MKSTAVGMGVFDTGAAATVIGLGASTADEAVGMKGGSGAGEGGNTLVLREGAPSSTGRGEAVVVPRPPMTGDGERTDDDPNTEVEEEEDCSSTEGDGAAGFRFLLSKSAKLAKLPPPLLSPNASDDDDIDAGGAGFVGVGPCRGLGGAGLGGGCFAFFGGNAGLGDSGRGGATDLLGLGVSI